MKTKILIMLISLCPIIIHSETSPAAMSKSQNRQGITKEIAVEKKAGSVNGNRNEKKIKKILGKPEYSVIYKVDSNYDFHSEIEPDYSKYFSEAELEKGITVKECYWVKDNSNIYVWMYKKNFEFIEFSSLEYTDDVVY